MNLLTLFTFVALLHTVQTLAKGNVLKPSLQLATTAQISDVQQYWVSEKLDGMRAYWNGQALFSRQGHQINAPSWYTEHWPDTSLDGELWSQRNSFESIVSCVRRKVPVDDCWQKIAFYVFDLPASKATFSQRIQRITAISAAAKTPYLKAVKQFRVTSEPALFALLDFIVANGGEGLMLHHEKALYRPGRSQHLIKLKKHYDAEAVVIKHISGKGKYQDMLGALLVRTPSGLEFKIGSGFTDQLRKHPPPIGSVITYKFIGKTARGVPRFASFLRIRR